MLNDTFDMFPSYNSIYATINTIAEVLIFNENYSDKIEYHTLTFEVVSENFKTPEIFNFLNQIGFIVDGISLHNISENTEILPEIKEALTDRYFIVLKINSLDNFIHSNLLETMAEDDEYEDFTPIEHLDILLKLDPTIYAKLNNIDQANYNRLLNKDGYFDFTLYSTINMNMSFMPHIKVLSPPKYVKEGHVSSIGNTFTFNIFVNDDVGNEVHSISESVDITFLQYEMDLIDKQLDEQMYKELDKSITTTKKKVKPSHLKLVVDNKN